MPDPVTVTYGEIALYARSGPYNTYRNSILCQIQSISFSCRNSIIVYARSSPNMLLSYKNTTMCQIQCMQLLHRNRIICQIQSMSFSYRNSIILSHSQSIALSYRISVRIKPFRRKTFSSKYIFPL